MKGTVYFDSGLRLVSSECSAGTSVGAGEMVCFGGATGGCRGRSELCVGCCWTRANCSKRLVSLNSAAVKRKKEQNLITRSCYWR